MHYIHSILARRAQAAHYWEMHLVHLRAQEFVHNSAFPGLAHTSAQVCAQVVQEVYKLETLVPSRLKCCDNSLETGLYIVIFQTVSNLET